MKSRETKEIIKKWFIQVNDLDFRNRKHFSIFAIFYLLFELPFLFLFFGADADCWRVADTAYGIFYNQYFETSRWPGYPIVEFGFAPFIWGGYILTNAVTLAISFWGIYAFNRILTNHSLKNHGILTLSLAVSPLWWVWSTQTMDFIWGISFLLISIWFVSENRYILSGIFLSLSVGSRITNGFFGLMFIVYIIFRRVKIKNFIIFLLSGFVTTLLWLNVMIANHGLEFYGIILAHEELEWNLLAAAKLVAYSYGLLFWLVVAILFLNAIVPLFYNNLNKELRSNFELSKLIKIPLDHPFESGIIISMCFFILSFLWQPIEIEHLIPIIPFSFILLGRILQRNHLWILFTVIIISTILPYNLNYAVGLRRIEKRIYLEQTSQKLVSMEFSDNDVLVAAWFEVRLNQFRRDGLDVNWEEWFEIVELPTIGLVENWHIENKTVYYLRSLENYILFHFPEFHQISAIPIEL